LSNCWFPCYSFTHNFLVKLLAKTAKMGFHVSSTIWPPTYLHGRSRWSVLLPTCNCPRFCFSNDSSLSTHGSMAFLTVVAGWRLPAHGCHMEIPPTFYSKNFNMETHPNSFLYATLYSLVKSWLGLILAYLIVCMQHQRERLLVFPKVAKTNSKFWVCSSLIFKVHNFWGVI
jgi:hypothetical protein